MLGISLRCALLMAVVIAVALVPASASADTEAITDGGFESTTCQEIQSDVECTNPSWEGYGIQQSTCTSPPCYEWAAHGAGYLRLGGAYMANNNWKSASVSQTIDLPQGGAKKLTFALRGVYDSPVSAGSINLKVDDDIVFGAGSLDVSDEYTTETIDLGDLAGEHELTFGVECVSFQTPFPEACDGFSIDDVSLRIPRLLLEITAGPPVTTERRRVRFAFAADDPAATFSCKLDGAETEPCTSPFRTRVGTGSHRLRVKAAAPGREGSRAVSYRWTVAGTR